MKPFIVLSLLLSSVSAFSQKNTISEDIHASLVQGKKRAQIVYAGAAHSFTMDVPLKTARNSDVPGFISIDKQIVQSTLVASQSFQPDNNATTIHEKELLTKYMNYELAYYRKKLKQNYSNLQTEWTTIQGRLFLIWYFDMPKDYKLVSRQIYFSTVYFDQIMDLNAPVFKADDFSRARNILVKLATSMKSYNKQLDLTAVSRQLNRL